MPNRIFLHYYIFVLLFVGYDSSSQSSPGCVVPSTPPEQKYEIHEIPQDMSGSSTENTPTAEMVKLYFLDSD